MNTAKLVNSALTGGGLKYPENLNVIIGNEDHGYPKGYVLDANAVASLTPSNGGEGNTQNENKIATVYKNPTTGYNNIIFDDDNKAANLIFRYKENLLQAYSCIINGQYNIVEGFRNFILGSSNYIKGKNNISVGVPKYSFIVITAKLGENKYQTNVKIDSEYGKYVLSYLTGNYHTAFLFKNIEDKNKFQKQFDNPEFYFHQLHASKEDGNEYVILGSGFLKNFYDKGYNSILIVGNEITGDRNIVAGRNNEITGNSSIANGDYNHIFNDNSITSGLGLVTYNYSESSFGCFNDSVNSNTKSGEAVTDEQAVKKSTIFSIGDGSVDKRSNAIEIKYNGDLYIQNIGGYNGSYSKSLNAKSLQQVISDIETAVSLNSNGPWDVDITSEFINGNVTIYPTQMWNINQASKRVYFLADLKQGDIITIPDTLRMYIGWKKADGTFGLADWNTAAKKYTATVDGKYVILVANLNDNPGVQTNTLPSFGKVMLKTSNLEFKPTAQIDTKKDHTNDDKVMRGIAHQGFHKTERANSLAAFRAAAKEGWRYVETDTYMTKDGKFVVSHDDNVPVGYTNGVTTLADKSYKYGDHTLADILAFHGPNGENVDTLEDFCKLCKECGLHPYIEIKQGMMWQNNTIDTTNTRYNGKPYAIKLLDIVNRYGLRGNATFISSTAYTLRLMADKDQSYRYGIVYFGKIGSSFSEWTTLLNQVNEFNTDAAASKAYLFADVNIDNLKTAEVGSVDKLAETGCQLEVWTVKIKEDLDNLDPYVTGVTSDNIHAGEILAKKI